MRVLDSGTSDFEGQLKHILLQRRDEMTGVESVVRQIIEDVRREGDEALLQYTERFDGVKISRNEMEIAREVWEQAQQDMAKEAYDALERAADRIESFHAKEICNSWFDIERGVVRGQIIRPLTRAGVYVPGGKAVYPSSLLMNVIPAKVAGVEEVVVVTPPSAEGVSPVILAAAAIAGVDQVLLAGGAQAVAALAYGTESVPQVDIVVGPGNIYVATAKRLLFGIVKVDMVAGPSEILVLSDGSVSPRFVAIDLLSQAEHDEMAWSMLITPSVEFADRVREEVRGMLEILPRQGIIAASLERHGLVIIVRDLEEGCEIANRIAPEHLELAVQEPFQWLGMVENAGTVFLGAFTPEAVGDYLGGPNHVLPTGGTARFFSPLGVEHFLKRTNILSLSREALSQVKEDIERLARLESLEAHAQAVGVREEEE